MAHKPLIDQKFEETQITSSQQESTQFIREIKGINTNNITIDIKRPFI